MLDLKKHGDVQLRKSRFGHFFQNGDTVCAYHSIKMETVYFPESIFAFIRQCDGATVNHVLSNISQNEKTQFLESFAKIANASILIPNEDDEMKLIRAVKKAAFHGPSIRVMVLHMTYYCNLNCKYCFIEGGLGNDYKRRNMESSVMPNSIDFFSRIISGRSFSKAPSIVFYGGEPLVNWSVMREGLEYLLFLERVDKIGRVDKILIIKGVLVTEDIAIELKRYGVMVSLSIDGPKNLHDANRVASNGKASFSQVMKGFQFLCDAGIKATVSCLMSKSSIGYEKNIMKFLIEDLGITALGFNHVSIVPKVTFYDP